MIYFLPPAKQGSYSFEVHKNTSVSSCVYIILFGDMMTLLIQQGLKVPVLGGTKAKEQNHNCVISNVILIEVALMD